MRVHLVKNKQTNITFVSTKKSKKSFVTPRPVSITQNSSTTFSSSEAISRVLSDTCPLIRASNDGVDLIAFLTRMKITCWRYDELPMRISGTSGATS
jgi:hypothetical protein